MHIIIPLLALDPEVKAGLPDKGGHSLLSASESTYCKREGINPVHSSINNYKFLFPGQIFPNFTVPRVL